MTSDPGIASAAAPSTALPGADGATVLLPPDRRARKKAETRRRLLDAARTLFVERGYHEVRPQDIARLADVASGTFYTHFSDKREVFLAFVAEAGDALLARIREGAPTGPDVDLPTLLGHALRQLLAFSDENPGVLPAAFFDAGLIDAGTPPETTLRGRLSSILAASVESRIESGRFFDDYDADLVGHAMVGLLQHALIHAGQTGKERERVIDNMTRFCRRALERPPSAPTPTGPGTRPRPDITEEILP